MEKNNIWLKVIIIYSTKINTLNWLIMLIFLIYVKIGCAWYLNLILCKINFIILCIFTINFLIVKSFKFIEFTLIDWYIFIKNLKTIPQFYNLNQKAKYLTKDVIIYQLKLHN